MFELLFKYPLSQYRQAEWFFASGWSVTALIAAIALLCALIAVSVARRSLGSGQKSLIWLLQSACAALALFMLWQPSLSSQRVLPGENTIGVMLDTSRSMHFSESGTTPLETAVAELAETELLEELQTEFKISLRSVAEQLDPLELTQLPPPGDSSRIKSALLELLDDNSNNRMTSVIVISDGSDTSNVDAGWWRQLSATGVPVYSVGVGAEALQSDLSLAAISMRDSITPDSRVNARLTIRHAQAGSVRLRVTDGDALLHASTLILPADTTESSHSIVFNSGDEGIKELNFALEPLAGEQHLANNQQRRILTVEDERKRILYVEGEPRWEYKFIRRALSESAEIEIVSLLQTSPNKYYRQGVRDAEELEDGFPSEEKTLFAYDAIIIGSIEAAKLSAEQQQHLRDFVRVRGGALLMLGGPHGLAEGGWSRTVVAQALPAQFNDAQQTYARKRARAYLTDLGSETEWLRFSADNAQNQALWAELPELADVQMLGAVKAGASSLLETRVDDSRIPLLVSQRYGRGKSFILATSGTWRWQMGLPAVDQRHEQFWQGLLGELVAGALEPLSIATSRAAYYDEREVDVTIDVRDERYQPDLNAELTASLVGDDIDADSNTNTAAIKLNPTETPGRYQATVSVPSEGAYAIAVAQADGETQRTQNAWFLREDNRVEDFALGKDTAFLRKLASETGGEYLEIEELDILPALLRQSQSLLVKEETLPLWNAPIIFLLLIFFKIVEWLLRMRWNRI